jgi:hypothetical protein
MFRYATFIFPTSGDIVFHLKHQATDAKITPKWNPRPTRIILLSATSTVRKLKGRGGIVKQMQEKKN